MINLNQVKCDHTDTNNYHIKVKNYIENMKFAKPEEEEYFSSSTYQENSYDFLISPQQKIALLANMGVENNYYEWTKRSQGNKAREANTVKGCKISFSMHLIVYCKNEYQIDNDLENKYSIYIQPSSSVLSNKSNTRQTSSIKYVRHFPLPISELSQYKNSINFIETSSFIYMDIMYSNTTN